MAIAIYDNNKLSIADFTNRIVTSHNGTLGEAVDVLLYLRNDSPHVYYTGISVHLQDPNGTDDTKGPEGSGWGVRLSSGPRRPTLSEWEAMPFDNVISLPDIGSTLEADQVTYFPFWARVSVPGNTVSMIKEQISLIVGGAERLLGT